MTLDLLQRHLKTEHDDFNLDAWNAFVQDVGLVQSALQQKSTSFDDARAQLIEAALFRINEVLLPAFEHAAEYQSAGFLSAPIEDDSEVTFATGLTTLGIAEHRRQMFVPSPYVALVRDSNPYDLAIAQAGEYNPETGALSINVLAVFGDPGPHSDVTVTATAGSAAAQYQFMTETVAAKETAVSAAGTATTKAGEATSAVGIVLGHKNAVDAAAQGILGSYAQGNFPVLRRDGTALKAGDILYDTTDHMTRVWTGDSFAPTISPSVAGVRMVGGAFGAAPDGVITVDGGFTNVMVYVNGALLVEGDDYTASSPTVTVTNPTQGDDWFVWGFLALDAADYPTIESMNLALAGKANTDHSHNAADIAGLATLLGAKAAVSHSHGMGDITGLSTALGGKANTSHTHTVAQISDFPTIPSGEMASLNKALVGDIRSMTGNVGITAAALGDAALPVEISGTSNINRDWRTFISASCVLTGNRTLTFTEVKAGTSRKITFKGDGATERTLTFGGSMFKGELPEVKVSSTKYVSVYFDADSATAILVTSQEWAP